MGASEFIENYFKLHGKPITLYPYQRKFLKDNHWFRYVNKSRRVGMTQTISWEAFYRAINIPNTWVAIVSVSDRAAKDVMSYIYDAYYSYREKMIEIGKPNLIPKWGVHSKSDLTFPELNSRLESLPNNPRTVRGKTITDLYLDEFAHYQSAEEMYSAILPSITLDRGGIQSKVTTISTPLAKFGPFYKFWAMKGRPEGKHINYHVIHWKECSGLKAKIDLIKRSMDEDQFKREYCNEFVDETLAALPFEEIKACVDTNLTNEYDLTQTKNPIYVGIDYGKVLDSTVIIVVERTQEEMIARHIKEFKPTKENPNSYKEASDYILRNYPRWKPSKIVVDMLGPGESTIEDLKSLGAVVKGENLTLPFKIKIFTNLKNLFLDRKIKIPNNENLINQLHALQKKTTETGQIRYTHPAKGDIQHDDYTWALALACYEGERGGGIGGAAVGLGRSTWDESHEEKTYGRTFKY